MDTFIILLYPLFFWIKFRQIDNRFFRIRESLLFLYINPKCREKFQIFRLLWLTVPVSPNPTRLVELYYCIHFWWYKLKIKLILKLTKREDQTLISISIILKFSALGIWEYGSVTGSWVYINHQNASRNVSSLPGPMHFSLLC